MGRIPIFTLMFFPRNTELIKIFGCAYLFQTCSCDALNDLFLEDRKNDDITFSYVAKFNMEDETNGSYRYIVLDYGSPYGNSY